MDETSPLPNVSAEKPSSGPRRRMRIAAGVAIAAVVAAAGLAVAATTGSGSHTSKSAAGAGSSSGAAGAAAIGGRSTAKSTKVGGPSTTGSTKPGSAKPGGPGRRPSGVTVPGETTTAVGTGRSSVTTRPGSPAPKGSVTSTAPPVPVPLSITQAYVQGYQDECHSLWSQAGPSGNLWDADSLEDPPHTIDECLSGLDPSNADIWAQYTPAEARDGGRADADTTADGMTVGNRFQTSTGLVVYIPNA